MRNSYAILLLTCLLLLPSCSQVGPRPCYKAPTKIKITSLALNKVSHEKLQSAFKKLNRTDSPSTKKYYNLITTNLLHKSYCHTKNLKTLTPQTGTWSTTLTPGTMLASSFDNIFPAYLVDTKPVLKNRFQTSGLGIPLIGWIKNPTSKPEPPNFMAPKGRAIPLTAIITYQNNKPIWKIYPSKNTRTLKLGKISHKLAADYSAANAVFWDRSTLRKNILTGLLLPDRITTGTGLYSDLPYDPNKIPVICVHGLKSSPDAFRFMTNQLRSVKEIRDNYQFVYFYYPTGASWIYNGKKFRADVRRYQQHAIKNGGGKNFDKMVILAHSMGGLISRTSISSNPQELYNVVYNRPIETIRGTTANRQLIEETLNFKPLISPKRIVFMATPHRGSTLADWKAVNILSQLIKLPTNTSLDILNILTQNGTQLLQGNTAGFRIPTSLSELSPNNPFIKAVPKLKFPSYMKVHSIIGAHRGNPKSDGVVPYWSSHLPKETTQSELVIDSWHNVPFKTEAIQETARILKLHLKQN